MGKNKVNIEITATDRTKGATKKAVKEIKSMSKAVVEVQKKNMSLSKALELVNRKLLRSTRETRQNKEKFNSLAAVLNRVRQNIGALNSKLERQNNINKLLARSLRRTNRELKNNKRQVKETKKEYTDFGKVLSKVKGSLGKGLGIVGLGSAAGGIYVLQRAIKDIIKTYTGFDDAARNAAAVLDRTEAGFKRISAVARKEGARTRYTAIQVAQGMEQLGRATGDVEITIAAIPKALALASAGKVDVADAIKVATGAMAAYKLESKDIGQVMDTLTHADTSTKATVLGLGESLTYVGGTARGAGADFEELIATLGLLAGGNLAASIGGTSLNQFFSMMLRPSGESEKMLKKIEARLGGIPLKLKDAKGAFIGFASIIEQLTEAGLDAGEALRLFNVRGGRVIQPLMLVGAEKIREAIKEYKNIAGLTNEVSEFKESGIGGVVRKLISVFQELKLAIGKAFGKEMIDIVDQLRWTLLDIIKNWDKIARSAEFKKWKKETITFFKDLKWIISSVVWTFQLLSKTAKLTYKTMANSLKFELLTTKIERRIKEDIVRSRKKRGVTDELLSEKDFKIKMRQYAEMAKRRKENRKAIEGQKPIGIAGFKQLEKPDFAIVEAERIRKLKETIAKELDSLRRSMADLSISEYISEEAFEAGKISIEKYFAGRKKALQDQFKRERNILTASLGLTKDDEKRKTIKTEIYELEKRQILDLMELDTEKAESKPKKEKKDKTKSATIAAKNILRKSIALAQTQGMKRKRDYEAGRMSIEEYFKGRKDAIDKKAQGKLDVLDISFNESTDEAEKARIKTEIFETEQQRLRDLMILEQDKADLEKKLLQEKKDATEKSTKMMQENFANTGRVMADMYKLGGKNIKALFYLSKAASLAAATMNIAEGITGVMRKGASPVEMIQAGIVAAMGAVQVATILSTNLADGGIVPGSSPHSKSDDKNVNLTSGEFVQQVSAVQYYGRNVMSAMNNGLIPKEVFAGIPHAPSPSSSFALAGGGIVSNADQATEAKEKDEINIINVTDSRQIDQYLSSSAGQNAIINVLSSKAQTVKRILR